MKENIEDYIPFMNWIIEVAEEKIIEHRLLKKEFSSHEEFIVFTIIWMRVYKNIKQQLKNEILENKKIDISMDKYFQTFYSNMEFYITFYLK